VAEGDARVPQVAAVLKQLWLGLAAYRLYPGSVDRPGFVAAVERIGAAARTALASGPVDVEVRGDLMVLEGVELPDDDHLQKLALACFERRVERLTVVGVPDASELERLYAVLSRGVDDLDRDGGAGEVLRSRGVEALELSRVGPAPVEGADHTPEGMEPEPGAARGPIADVLASELMVEDLHGTTDDQAETLLSRLGVLLSERSSEAPSPIDLNMAVHDMVTELPAELRRSLVDRLVERVRTDPVAERLIGTMSNAELTRALIDLGRDGRRDPVQLARQLAQAGVRRLDIVDLTAALAAGHEDAGTIVMGQWGSWSTDATLAFWSKFQVLFAYPHPWVSTGLPSSGSAEVTRLLRLVHDMAPGFATFAGIVVQTTAGQLWGWPRRSWGEGGTWNNGGASVLW